MSENTSQSATRPMPTGQAAPKLQYRRPWPADWWLRRPSYFLFMFREFTALFVGAYAVFLLVLMALPQDAFIAVLRSPVSMVLQLIALLMVLFHTVTWLNLTPRVLVLWRGEERVSPALITGAHYVAWLVLSLLIVGLAIYFA
jgi:fumarate reductase subunit C